MGDSLNITIFETGVGKKLLKLMTNETYPTVMRFIKKTITKACQYFEHNFYLYYNYLERKKAKGDKKKKTFIYYFNDNYVNANCFTYLNGSVNVKFLFFYILKIFFYLKNNPYSSAFDIYKNIEFLAFCDLNFLLKAMHKEGFISFQKIFVSKKSQLYKLHKNYKILYDYNNLMIGRSSANKPTNTDFDLFENSTGFEDSSTDTDTPILQPEIEKEIFKKKKSKKWKKKIFLDKMLFKTMKLYHVHDENVILKKYAETLWN